MTKSGTQDNHIRNYISLIIIPFIKKTLYLSRMFSQI